MTTLFDVILPVFLLIGFGYLATARRLFSDSATDGVMKFAQNFALPVLLFQAMSRLDLGAEFDLALLASFYSGAFLAFGTGLLVARYGLKRSPEEAVAIAFTCYFSNSLLLGVPITERAYGTQALTGNFMIIAMHSPLLYTFAITLMEFTKARGTNLSVGHVALRALSGVLKTPLVIGILAGLLVNLAGTAGLVLPQGFWDAVAMMARAAVPAALFGLGGILHRYRPEGDAAAIATCCACSLVLHPVVTYGMGQMLGLTTASLRSAVLTAAMAPGVNAYLFANLYGVAKRTAASSVLLGTAASILTIWLWLTILP